MARRTILFTGKNELHLEEEPIPAPGPNELLVETTRTLISTGTELICLTRNFSPGTHWDAWVKYPFRVGYLNCGRVIGIGEGVTDWKVGDRVASRAGHTSHTVVGANHAFRVPENVSDDEACWLGLGKITQIGVRSAHQQLGDDVVIIGLGLIGQLVCQYARLNGAGNVIAIDTAPRRLEMATAHGATHMLNMSAADALARVQEITQCRRADVVYEVTGHPSVLATALPLARPFGTLLLLGDTGTPGGQTLTTDVVVRGVKIIGAHDSHPPHDAASDRPWPARRINELFLSYLARGQIRVKDLITHRYTPDRARNAYDLLLTDRQLTMGVMFEWST
ncbi:MAG TPA: zinc-binding alcohol dehydrogenase [Tepidisphaeraceae bacterium]|jgi:2-desacetyl-2-hydroxyethyl bacteriochlorophyllide A dehydrogenase|nr:zinc-binding alcohol dehydrogenase [Tepidisphaeraceae bacterium]